MPAAIAKMEACKMRISNLSITNFKAISRFSLADLGDVIVIAGPNGCGKSCVLDAIRLLKSVYGGYRQQNEWHSFFSEFQINIEQPADLQRLFQDKTQPIRIAATFQLASDEVAYIRETSQKT